MRLWFYLAPQRVAELTNLHLWEIDPETSAYLAKYMKNSRLEALWDRLPYYAWVAPETDL